MAILAQIIETFINKYVLYILLVNNENNENNENGFTPMKNVKIKVETDDQNLNVQERLCELNKENGRSAWYVRLDRGYYDSREGAYNRAVSSRKKHYRFLVINKWLDLVIFIDEDDWKKRKEKEVSFDEFMGRRSKQDWERGRGGKKLLSSANTSSKRKATSRTSKRKATSRTYKKT